MLESVSRFFCGCFLCSYNYQITMTRPQTKETWFIFLSVIFVIKFRGVLCEINTLSKLLIQIRNISLSNIQHTNAQNKFSKVFSSFPWPSISHTQDFLEPHLSRSIFFSFSCSFRQKSCQNSFFSQLGLAPLPSVGNPGSTTAQ